MENLTSNQKQAESTQFDRLLENASTVPEPDVSLASHTHTHTRSLAQEDLSQLKTISLPKLPRECQVLILDQENRAETLSETSNGLRSLRERNWSTTPNFLTRVVSSARNYLRERSAWVTSGIKEYLGEEDTLPLSAIVGIMGAVVGMVSSGVYETRTGTKLTGEVFFGFFGSGFVIGAGTIPTIFILKHFKNNFSSNFTKLKNAFRSPFITPSDLTPAEAKALPKYESLYKTGKRKGWSENVIHSYILEEANNLDREATSAKSTADSLRARYNATLPTEHPIFIDPRYDRASFRMVLARNSASKLGEEMLKFLHENQVGSDDDIFIRPVPLELDVTVPGLLALNGPIHEINSELNLKKRKEKIEALFLEIQTAERQLEYFREMGE